MRRAALVATLLVAVVAGAEPRTIELALKDGRLPDTQRLVRVQQGDEVTLTWTTDRPYTLHLHGYELEATLTPDKPATVRFTAGATGRFPMEIHGPRGEERTVGYLEVHPR